MSARIKLNAGQVDRLASALRHLTTIRTHTHVEIDPHSHIDVSIDGNIVAVRWDTDVDEYVVDDLIGD